MRKTILSVLFLLAAAACNAQESKSDAGTVLITGANRGIGLELARQYAADGWQVIGTARRPDSATDLQALNVRVVQLDVTDQASVEQLAATLDGDPIDVLINNAGILPRVYSINDVDFSEFDQIMAVNTTGPMRVVQALLPNLAAGFSKKIINTTSVLGSITQNTGGGFYGYRESKAALNMFTRSLAAELQPKGYTCIVIHPGWVQTDMGGPNATVTVPDSAAGIRDVVENIALEDTGTFWTFEGQKLPW